VPRHDDAALVADAFRPPPAPEATPLVDGPGIA
jgi:hypothetical protein